MCCFVLFCRRAELDGLKQAEVERAASGANVIGRFAVSTAEGLTERAERMLSRLGLLCNLLESVLNEFLMPEDLPDLAPGDESIRCATGSLVKFKIKLVWAHPIVLCLKGAFCDVSCGGRCGSNQS